MDVDVSSSLLCDPIYNPPNCVSSNGDTNHKFQVRQNVGIDLGVQPQSMPSFGSNGRVQIQLPEGDNRRQLGSGEGLAQIFSAAPDSTEIGANSNSSSNSPNENESAMGSSFDQSSLTGSASNNTSSPTHSFNGASVSGINQNDTGKRLVNGLMYSDDQPGAVKSPQIENHPTLYNRVLAQPTQAVDLNRENSGHKNDENTPAQLSASSQSNPSPFGQFHSGGDNQGQDKNQSTPDGFLERLKSIASNMGESFFGLGGGAPGSHSRRNGNSTNFAPQQLRHLSENHKGDVRGLLQRQLDQYRGIASQLEFSSAQTNIFGHVCKQYKRYTQVHRIANIEHSCPSN